MNLSLRSLILLFWTSLLINVALPINRAMAQVNGPTCGTYTRESFDGKFGTAIVTDLSYSEGTIYVSKSKGIRTSGDGGKTFTTASGLEDQFINSVKAVGFNVYAITNFGLGISSYGDLFKVKTTADGLGSDLISSVEEVNGIHYVSTAAGLAISTDQGNTFTKKTTADGLGSNNVSSVYD